ncbi:putative acetyltransferase [Pseudoalteromonas sp. 3J6]|uniref:GNAT family N-acetyltransferase n=1 Tax=Pseudoalteromonas sp. 3J6 TaxID=649161 RepID=UPI001768A684|nr:putative acetyltransferase [Pseudoalteromonas sp. 3J6]
MSLNYSIELQGVILNIAFRTERLLLRFAQIADAAELLKLVNQANFIKYIGDKDIYTLDDAKKYIKDSFIAAHKEHGFGPYMITLHDETVVGIVGFYQRATMQHPDLGFALKVGFEKKGYIFEAATILLYNRHKLGIKDVCAITSTANLGSQNVLYKLGFTEVGKAVINADKTTIKVFIYD